MASQKLIKNNLILELHVPNFNKVIRFYSKLGFEVISEDSIGQQLGYLVLKRTDKLGKTLLNFYGGDERVFKHSFFNDFPTHTKRGYEVEITIPVNDVDSFYKQVLPDVKDSIVQELALKRWGKKDFRIIDPFGFYLRFTEMVDWF